MYVVDFLLDREAGISSCLKVEVELLSWQGDCYNRSERGSLAQQLSRTFPFSFGFLVALLGTRWLEHRRALP